MYLSTGLHGYMTDVTYVTFDCVRMRSSVLTVGNISLVIT